MAYAFAQSIGHSADGVAEPSSDATNDAALCGLC